MSPILTLQRQMREIGRIRTGNQVASGRGKTRPNKLDTFRLTSPSRELIAAAAETYGGVAAPWTNDGRQEYEVITEAASMDIVVPPGQVVSQWYEMWSGGGCVRRCDGVTNVLDMTPCACPQDTAERVAQAAEGLACKATTRLNVILPRLPDLGVWRLESHGYYAAVELAGAAEVLAMASAAGRLIPARLRLDKRSKKVPGKPTKQYTVAVIEFGEAMFDTLGITGGDASTPARLTAGVGVPQLPSTTLPPSSDFRAPTPGAEADDVVVEGTVREVPAPMSAAVLNTALEEAGISREAAVERSRVLFPRPPEIALTDEQRAQLYADLTAPAGL